LNTFVWSAADAAWQQTASAVFPEGLIGQSFYDWFTIGQFLISSSSLIEPVSTGFVAADKPVETG
jgi:hypothetical protein